MEEDIVKVILLCVSECGVSKSDIARASGVSPTNISYLITGRRRHVRNDTEWKLRKGIANIYRERKWKDS